MISSVVMFTWDRLSNARICDVMLFSESCQNLVGIFAIGLSLNTLSQARCMREGDRIEGILAPAELDVAMRSGNGIKVLYRGVPPHAIPKRHTRLDGEIMVP